MQTPMQQVSPTLFTTPTPRAHPMGLLVREYTSVRAFYHDAQELYLRTGYTISSTSGLAHRGYIRRILDFWGLRQEQMVITYQSPTNAWQEHANPR